MSERDELIAMLWRVLKVQEIANDPNAIRDLDAEGVVVAYFNGPVWDETRNRLAEIEHGK